MAQTRSQSSAMSSADDPAPPPAVAIFLIYLLLGTVLSLCFRRDPGTPLPPAHELARNVSPSMAIICFFLVSYSLLDVMAVGAAKQKYDFSKKKFGPWVHNPPEEVYLPFGPRPIKLSNFLVSSLDLYSFQSWSMGTWGQSCRLYGLSFVGCMQVDTDQQLERQFRRAE